MIKVALIALAMLLSAEGFRLSIALNERRHAGERLRPRDYVVAYGITAAAAAALIVVVLA